MDIAGIRSETLQIITIATLMVGFGLLGFSFQPEIEALGAFLKNLRDPPDEGGLGLSLSYLTVIIGMLIMAQYIGMLEEARRLFARTNLPDEEGAERQEIAERQGILLGMLMVLAGGTFLLFVAQQLAKAASS